MTLRPLLVVLSLISWGLAVHVADSERAQGVCVMLGFAWCVGIALFGEWRAEALRGGAAVEEAREAERFAGASVEQRVAELERHYLGRLSEASLSSDSAFDWAVLRQFNELREEWENVPGCRLARRIPERIYPELPPPDPGVEPALSLAEEIRRFREGRASISNDIGRVIEVPGRIGAELVVKHPLANAVVNRGSSGRKKR
jgi:hypothetical protein